MKQKKIRGFNRRFRDIEKWKNKNLELRNDLIEKYKADRIEILVHPWCDISIIKSKIPEPKRKTKRQIINGLIEIYESWKIQLDKLGQPYYLKIWLFEPRLSRSQVVCAIEDSIDFYETNFFKSDYYKAFNSFNYGQLGEKLKKFNWEHRLDEDHYVDCEVGEPDLYDNLQDYEETKRWFNRLLIKPHRLFKFNNPIGDATESYSFKRGDLWIGEIKKNND